MVWDILSYISVAVLGLCLGSFTTALTYRLKHHLPFAWGPDGQPVRSMCPPCGRTLTPRELIPVLSWVLQHGRCQCGKTRIPVFYPMVELATMALSMIIFVILGITVWTLLSLILLPFLLAFVLGRLVI